MSVVLTEGQRLRLDNLTKDPRAVGFPEHHQIMHTLLAVPIVSGGKVLGSTTIMPYMPLAMCWATIGVAQW